MEDAQIADTGRDDLATKLLDTTDAMVWADAFCGLFHSKRVRADDGPEGSVDVDLMVTWFANAIETGRNAGRFEFQEKMRAAVDAVFFGDFPPEVKTERIDGTVGGRS